MQLIRVILENSSYGYSAYMDNDDSLDYSCLGEGKTIDETIADFYDAYSEMKEYYASVNKYFEEVEFEFYYDIASFLEKYYKKFSLAGLEQITGVNQTQLGHYLHGRRKPSKKTIAKIQKGVEAFAKELTELKFVNGIA